MTINGKMDFHPTSGHIVTLTMELPEYVSIVHYLTNATRDAEEAAEAINRALGYDSAEGVACIEAAAKLRSRTNELNRLRQAFHYQAAADNDEDVNLI